jgi:hypothetical protein
MENTKLKDRLNGKIQTKGTTSQERSIIPTSNSTILAPLETGYVALNTNAMDIIKENL